MSDHDAHDAKPVAPAKHDDWPKVLEWIEKQGQDSLGSRFATAELIAKEAQTTLTVFLAAIGGSLAFAAKLLEPGTFQMLPFASAVVCAYLGVLSAVLIMKCMTFDSYPGRYQEPANLMQPAFSLDAFKKERAPEP